MGKPRRERRSNDPAVQERKKIYDWLDSEGKHDEVVKYKTKREESKFSQYLLEQAATRAARISDANVSAATTAASSSHAVATTSAAIAAIEESEHASTSEMDTYDRDRMVHVVCRENRERVVTVEPRGVE